MAPSVPGPARQVGLRSFPPNPAPVLPTAPAPVEDAKLCHVCGENVSGRQRYRDSVGRYWCTDCREADERKNESRCPDCGKLFPPDKLFEFQLTGHFRYW